MSNLSAAIVLAAGFGKRMNSSTPKVLHPICGMPMLGHVLETVEELKPNQIIASKNNYEYIKSFSTVNEVLILNKGFFNKLKLIKNLWKNFDNLGTMYYPYTL